jgi:hypothetical protein
MYTVTDCLKIELIVDEEGATLAGASGAEGGWRLAALAD